MLRHVGQRKKYKHEILGYNSRLDNLQAAWLRIKLPYLNRWNEARRMSARLYGRLLGNSPLSLPVEPAGCRGVYHLYVVRHPRRDDLARHLARNGVETGLHYPQPLHLTSAYRPLGHRFGDFPVSERLSREVLSLPMFYGLSEREIAAVASSIRSFRG